VTKMLPLFAGLLLLVGGVAAAQQRPDPRKTPGVINPDVTSANLDATICRPGYTREIRPEAAYTNRIKREQLNAMGGADPKEYELDHLIPLSLGGHPNDPRNLWTQPRSGEWNAQKKNNLALRLRGLVCRREVELGAAQQEIARDWIGAYRRYCPSGSSCPAYAPR
jgi:hypothetical protein